MGAQAIAFIAVSIVATACALVPALYLWWNQTEDPHESKPKKKAFDSRSNDTEPRRKCKNCEERPSMKIYPCLHSVCTECLAEHLESDGRCSECKGKIESCVPQSKRERKCKNCLEISDLILVQPCGHSSVCDKCFNKHLVSSDACPDCEKKIKRCLPHSKTRGKCNYCEKFSLLRQFLPCGHCSFCDQHARKFIIESEGRCFECGCRIAEVL